MKQVGDNYGPGQVTTTPQSSAQSHSFPPRSLHCSSPTEARGTGWPALSPSPLMAGGQGATDRSQSEYSRGYQTQSHRALHLKKPRHYFGNYPDKDPLLERTLVRLLRNLFSARPDFWALCFVCLVQFQQESY